MALYPVFLTFSPSGYFLAYAFSYFLRLAISLASVTILMSLPSEAAGFYICIWGVKTGVIINNIKHQEPLEFVFSGNHRTAALLWKDGTFHIYDGPNGTCIYKDKLMPSADFLLGSQWTHEESLQFPTIVKNNGKLVVSIQEFQPNSTPPFSLIRSFLIPPHDGKISFSPVLFHASFVTRTEVIILNVQDLRVLLKAEASSYYTSPGLFSSDGCFFACAIGKCGIGVWKNTSTNYVPWSSLQPKLLFKEFSFSPTKSSTLTWGGKGIQLLEPGNHPTNLSPNKLKHHPQNKSHPVAYSANGIYIVTAQKEDRIVTALNTLLNTPKQSFDTNMPILDIKIVNNIVFAAGRHRFVKWHLEVEGAMCNSHSTMRVTVDETYQISSIVTPIEHLTLSGDCSNIAFVCKMENFIMMEISCMMYKLRELSGVFQ